MGGHGEIDKSELERLCEDLPEGTYSLMSGAVLEYTLHKKSIIFKGTDAILVIIRSFNTVETMQKRATEDRFKSVLLSTVTHDIKTPLTALQNNLSLLLPHVQAEGREYYEATSIATRVLEFYLYDIIVFSLSHPA